MAATVQDFLNAYNNHKYKNQVSQYDYNMGMANPDIGLQLLGLKDQWNTPGATSEQQLLVNQQAEALRKQYGGTASGQYNYTGGADGSGYNPILPTVPAATPTPVTASEPYQSQYQDEISSLLSRVADFDYGPAPTYNNRYDPQIQTLLDAIVNRPEFSYDKNTDPNWNAYAKQYRREGELAARDTAAAQAARSGGLQSSSSASAASQANNYYASKLSDMLPQLYQQAYDRYSNEYQMKRQALGDVYTQEQADYGKYTDALGQWNTDRSFEYGALNNALGQYQGQDATDYGRFTDQRTYDTNAARYIDDLIQQNFVNSLSQQSATQQTAQQALENSRYDTEYADLLKQRQFENALAEQQAALDARNTSSLIASRAAAATATTAPIDYETLFAEMDKQKDPEAWLRLNYAALGIPAGQIAGLLERYAATAKESSDYAKSLAAAQAAVAGTGNYAGPPTPANLLADRYANAALSAAAETAYKQAGAVLIMGGTTAAAKHLIGLVSAGTITEAEAEAIANRLGI